MDCQGAELGERIMNSETYTTATAGDLCGIVVITTAIVVTDNTEPTYDFERNPPPAYQWMSE